LERILSTLNLVGSVRQPEVMAGRPLQSWELIQGECVVIVSRGHIRRFVVLILILFSLMANLSPGVSAQGNSEAAHACQQGGYADLIGVGGETFSNEGECVRFAAQGGVFAAPLQGTIVVPAGYQVTFSNTLLSACNGLAYGYSIDGMSFVQLGSKPEACITTYPANVTVGPFSTAVVLLVYLTDLTCGGTFDSDSNHGYVVDNAPYYQIGIADAGPGCVRPDGYELTSGGNLQAQLTIH
jgi:hypothetical protein